MATSGPPYKSHWLSSHITDLAITARVSVFTADNIYTLEQSQGFEVERGLEWDYPNSMLKSVHFDRLAIALWFPVLYNKSSEILGIIPLGCTVDWCYVRPRSGATEIRHK